MKHGHSDYIINEERPKKKGILSRQGRQTQIYEKGLRNTAQILNKNIRKVISQIRIIKKNSVNEVKFELNLEEC